MEKCERATEKVRKNYQELDVGEQGVRCGKARRVGMRSGMGGARPRLMGVTLEASSCGRGLHMNDFDGMLIAEWK
jgi:hypothetical protein